MKIQNLALLSLGAMQPLPVFAQGECPAGYSMSISIITVTATPEPTTTVYSTSYTTKTQTVYAGQTDGAQTLVAGSAQAPAASSTGADGSSNAASGGDPAIASVVSPPDSSASAASSAAPPTTSGAAIGANNAGQATFYGGNVAGGKCSFSTYTLPAGMYGTALSDANWSDAANCGACVSVTGPNGNSITAMIVDECPGCGSDHLDLFPDAFAALADPSTGVINVNWSLVDCGISSPLSVHNKDGTSQYWFSMQVVNANEPVTSLDVSTDGGNTWQGTTRQDYNFFENASGFGTDTVDVKVTGSSGNAVVINGVSITSGSSMTAGSNLL